MSNIASAAIGSTIARGAASALGFGGGGGGGGEAEQYEQPEVAAPGQAPGAIPDGVCARFVTDFQTCMSQSGHDVAACKWPMNLLEQCQEQQGQDQQDRGFAGGF